MYKSNQIYSTDHSPTLRQTCMLFMHLCLIYIHIQWPMPRQINKFFA